MGSRSLFGGLPTPSGGVDPFVQVPGSLRHLAEPMFDPEGMIDPLGTPTVADRNWYTVRTDPDGTIRSVLAIAKGERVDPERIEQIKAEQTMFGLTGDIAHDLHAGRRPVSANPKDDSDLARAHGEQDDAGPDGGQG